MKIVIAALILSAALLLSACSTETSINLKNKTTLTVYPSDQFKGWLVNGELVSDTTITVNANAEVELIK